MTPISSGVNIRANMDNTQAEDTTLRHYALETLLIINLPLVLHYTGQVIRHPLFIAR